MQAIQRVPIKAPPGTILPAEIQVEQREDNLVDRVGI